MVKNMADIITTTLEEKTLDDLVAKKLVSTAAEPTLTKTVVSAVITQLKDVEANGGYGDIAQAVGLGKVTKDQVRNIHEKMKARIAELTPKEDA